MVVGFITYPDKLMLCCLAFYQSHWWGDDLSVAALPEGDSAAHVIRGNFPGKYWWL
ncbi:hypothetical protein ACNKHR_07225 [Shigella flexneri]